MRPMSSMIKRILIIMPLIWLNLTALAQGNIELGSGGKIELNGGAFSFDADFTIEGDFVHSGGELILDQDLTVINNGDFIPSGGKITLPVNASTGTYDFEVGTSNQTYTPVTIEFTEAPSQSGYISVQPRELKTQEPDSTIYPLDSDIYFFCMNFSDDGEILDRHSSIYWEVSSSTISSGKYSISTSFDYSNILYGINNENKLHLVRGGDIPTSNIRIDFDLPGNNIYDTNSDGLVQIGRSDVDDGVFGNFFIGTSWTENNLVAPPSADLIFEETFTTPLSFNKALNGWKDHHTEPREDSTSGYESFTEGSNTAYRFIIDPEQSIHTPDSDKRYRSEIRFYDAPHETKPEPAELWYSWDFRIDTATNILDDFKHVAIGQWHSTGTDNTGDCGCIGTSPVVSIDYRDESVRLLIRSNSTLAPNNSICNPSNGCHCSEDGEYHSVQKGVWYNVKLHIIWSQDSDIGLAEFWFDGEGDAAKDSIRYPTLQNGAPNYPKLGIYANSKKENLQEFTSKMIIDYDNFRIGKTEAAVSSGSSSRISQETILNAVENPSFEEITIYPNPAINKLNVMYSLDHLSDVSISAFSMSGKKIDDLFFSKNQASGNKELTIDIAHIEAGQYVIVTRINNSVHGQILLVEK